MNSLWRRVWKVGLAGCLCWRVGHAAAVVSDPDAFLKQTQALATVDHPRFLRQLALLNQEASGLTPSQQWRLRYSNAWEAMYRGDYAESEALFLDIIRHSGSPRLVDRSSGQLLNQFGITRRYTDAFELANRVAARLPLVTDRVLHVSLLLNLLNAMRLAGQTDLAVRYARMAVAMAPSGAGACWASSSLVDALNDGHRLTSDSPELQRALDACAASGELVYSTNLQLVVADLYVHEGRPRKALALLARIRPSLDANGFEPAKLSAQVSRAQAFAALGDDDAAKKAALIVVQGRSSGSDLWLKDAYEVLYRIEKKQGNAAAALDYYEKYTALDKAYLSDVNARTLAYETVQQHVLAQRLETEQLARQNAGLRLQQQLAAKTAEANRLYIALLALALGFGVFVMVRLKRSQLRYRRLSRLDGLTELLNRQHFMGDAELVLQRLHKRGGEACLAYLDLDHFKRINDTHGHAAGDTVLRDVVAVCRQQLRSLDLFGRLGGEEFGILLVDTSREQAWAIAGRIRQAVAASPVAFGEDRIAVSVSIGLACADSSGHDLQRLCMDADAALYLAKDSGRNCVVTDGGGAGLNQRTPTSSTSKTSTASGGMSSPSPRLP